VGRSPEEGRAGGGRRVARDSKSGCRSVSAGGIEFRFFFHLPEGESSYWAACGRGGAPATEWTDATLVLVPRLSICVLTIPDAQDFDGVAEVVKADPVVSDAKAELGWLAEFHAMRSPISSESDHGFHAKPITDRRS
jgi:hypothetical protein